MRVIVHDLTGDEFLALGIECETDIVVSDDGTIKPCIGCFGCWIRTPGVCVLKDSYQNMGEKLSKSSELLVITRCVYGSYSPFVRNVWDRSIPYVLPFFVTKDDETHHTPRYENRIKYAVHFYGPDITDAEKDTAKRLVHANAKNFYADVADVAFYERYYDIKEKLAK